MITIAKKYRVLTGILLGLAFYLSGAFQVQAACTVTETVPALQTYPIPFNRIFPNVHNNNTLLHVDRFINTGAVRCSSGTIYFVVKVESTLGTTGTFIGNSPVYKTNIDGLGVYFDMVQSNGMAIGSTISSGSVSHLPNTGMHLVKLTNTTIGGVLDASTFPVLSFYATESSSGAFNSSAVQLTKAAASGVITYMVPSCSAGDKDVWLGEHAASSFTGSSTTDWVDAGLVLTCDMAFGNTYSSQTESYITGNLTSTTRADNLYSVSLDAVNGFIDSTRGIMALDNGGATGIGIQISRTQSEQSWSSLSWIAENQAGANTIKIPLYARYIQTNSTVTSGQANSKLIYTVQYK
ncbi:fimbrial protein [Entomohabitans teleogrylli]|uniref:fimbrial protein n=1 Tax=Entomohabitans teleogrylli TaxID=1384589 RepID=UPI00073D32DE|nr:hypothetical protein [Entomohabitans teleogrylli]